MKIFGLDEAKVVRLRIDSWGFIVFEAIIVIVILILKFIFKECLLLEE